MPRDTRIGALALPVLVTVGLVGGGLTAWACATSSILGTPDADALVRGTLVILYVLAGVYTLRRRPAEPFGAVLVFGGTAYAFTALNASGDGSLFAVGRLLSSVFTVILYYAFLSFPSGRLSSRLERGIILGYATAVAILWPAIALVARTLPVGGALAYCGARCPTNDLRLSGVESQAPVTILTVVMVVAALAVVGVLARKARSPVGVERWTVAPVLLAAVVVVVSTEAFTLHQAGGAWRTANLIATGLAAALVPIAFVLGPWRADLFVSTSLWRGLSGLDYTRLSVRQVEDVARRALGDASLRLALWSPTLGLRDLDGEPAAPVSARPSVTRIDHDGRSYAVVHHPALDHGYESLVAQVCTLAFTLIEYARPLREVTYSRRRLAESESEERSRLERDLHDSAQQRLLTIQMKLADLQAQVGDSDLATPIRELSDDAASAVAEIRRVAHGIYPALLLERGVGDALREVPSPPSISLRVVDNGIGRLPVPVERAVYFATLEAIQNATKHADPRTVTVALEPLADLVEVTVEDDGAGFEASGVASGSALVGIRDRIESVGGSVQVTSSPERSTTVRFLVPRRTSGGENA